MQIRRYFQLLLLAWVALGITPALAQPEQAKVSWGKELRQPGNTTLRKIVHVGPEGLYTLREKGATAFSSTPRVFLEFYNRSMDLQRGRDFDLKYNRKVRTLEDVMMLKGRLLLFSSFFNQAHKKNYLFVQEVNPQRLTPDKRIDMIAEMETPSRSNTGDFDFILSKDSSKLLIVNRLPHTRKNAGRFAFRVFNPDMQLLWHQDVELPYSEDLFSIEDYRIDNDGNVYLLGIVYPDDGSRNRRRGNLSYKYVLLSYRANSDKPEEYRLDLGDKFITDLTFRVADDGELICTGFYSDRSSYGIKGTYYFRIDPVLRRLYNQNIHPFDINFLTEHLSERKRDQAVEAEERGDTRRQIELYDYKLDELVLRSDGGALLVAEQYYIYEQYYRTFDGILHTVTYYNYNDVIVVNIRPSGEIEWVSRVPKRQTTTDDGGFFSSYAMAIVRDRLYFVYNDNPRNMSSGGAPAGRLYNFNGTNSVIALAEVQRGGQVKTYPVASNREANVLLRPKMCRQIGLREIALYGELNRRYRMGSLRLP
jgi:hypothetical protein